MKILAHASLEFIGSRFLCEVEQLSMELGSGAGDERNRVDRPGLAIDIREGAASFGDEAACAGVDGRDPADNVGRDPAGGQVG
jgi:hypothetical protein